MDLHSSQRPATPELTRNKSPLLSYINKQHTYLFSLLLLILTTTILFYTHPNPFYPQSSNLHIPEIPLTNCDYSNGRWVSDESSLLYTEECQFLDPGFRCHRNGRMDQNFRRWRWQPHGCDLPRFNASDFLERSRNGRIVFAGDSIGRNQWESLLCMLAEGVTNKSNIYEQNGNPITKHKGFLSIVFCDYNLTVEYYRVPFLVPVARPPPKAPEWVRAAIRLDSLHWFSKKWLGADVLVFNGGHWWNKHKTTDAGAYFEEAGTINLTLGYMEAFHKSLKTLRSWAIQNLYAQKTHVFFRSLSPAHHMNGSWSEGGTCRQKKAPEAHIKSSQWCYSLHNQFISDTIDEMKAANRSASYLNITYMAAFRTDGHPSVHREPGTPIPVIEDCSHWCLPGVPDVWNMILYAHLVEDGFRIGSR